MAMLLSELAIAPLPSGLGNVEITGLTADSREVKPGYLFAALPGTRVDGARFIDDAVAAGAAAVLGSKDLPPGVGGTVPVLRDDNPRKALALMAAKFAGRQPETVVAVTGTNGKTSVAAFVRQIWTRLGLAAASLGTTGVISPTGTRKIVHTTPDPIVLHEMLERLADEGVEHLALEASSHGLQQNRLDGVRIAAGAFTNITRDHLDYHSDFDEYFAAKMRLFTDLIDRQGVAVINADVPEAEKIAQLCLTSGLKLMRTGSNGAEIKLMLQKRKGFASALKIGCEGKEYDVELPLVGDFQVSNALVAAGLVIATGGEPGDVFEALAHLEGAPGRLELVTRSAHDAPIFVDYAHTPDALETALGTLRPYVDGQLKVVFGCGGDRDRGKRPLMGEVAARLADVCYVTDDNPRTEDPAAIRRQIMETCPGGIEIDDRASAIKQAVAGLHHGDILLVAGKGHETGQIVGNRTLPFSDQDVVLDAVGGAGGALWSVEDIVAATGGVLEGTVANDLSGVSIDTRTLEPGDIFFAIVGEVSDGHDYVANAFEAGAGLVVVARKDENMAQLGPLLVVDDTLRALENLGRAARTRSEAKIIAVTGSVGKTSTKEALKLALGACGKTHASVASYNNHWGVPLTLARMPRDTDFGVFEIGMNHAGEITPLTKMVRPHVAVITCIAESHLGHFSSLDEIADAKAEIFSGVEPGGVAVLLRDGPYFDRLSNAARGAGVSHIVSFGRDEAADARLVDVVLHQTCSCVRADVFGEDVCFKVGAAGEHMVINALAVLAAARLAGGDLARSAIALAEMKPAKGRGVRMKLAAPGGNFIVIDESYNANPTSMRAALALLAAATPHGHGRRIAVVGDMLELGKQSIDLHVGLAESIISGGISTVFACGEHMAALWKTLPVELRGVYGKTSDELRKPLLEAIGAGDVVMIKGSLGSRMGPLVAAIQEKFNAAPNAASGDRDD